MGIGQNLHIRRGSGLVIRMSRTDWLFDLFVVEVFSFFIILGAKYDLLSAFTIRFWVFFIFYCTCLFFGQRFFSNKRNNELLNSTD